MNIFVLDENPVKAAQYLCDKHIVKMALESAQILCTVSWQCDVSAPYKPTHIKHPVVIWAGETLANYNWLLEHAIGICEEFVYRFNHNHKSEQIIRWCENHAGRPDCGELTPFAQAMPMQYRSENAVESYRMYYMNDKKSFAKWKPITRVPDWWIE